MPDTLEGVPPFRLAHAWPGRHWPHTAAGERAFVAELARRARRRSSRFDRNDVTWVLTALRAGATGDSVAQLAKGVDPGRLYAAYTELEALRHEAATAWRSLCRASRPDALERHGPVAAKLLPVPVTRLYTAGANLPEAAGSAAAEVARMHRLSDAVSATVEQLATVSEPAAQLEARRLWAPSGACLWNDPYFLPRRVGELTPVRAADLLGVARGEDLT